MIDILVRLLFYVHQYTLNRFQRSAIIHERVARLMGVARGQKNISCYSAELNYFR